MEQLVVIDGSPKGKKSITLKFVEYLQKKNPQIEFCYFHVAQDIRKYAKGTDNWKPLEEALKSSSGVIWCFPVYVFQAPASMMAFVELISEMGMKDAFSGKYAAAVSTSIHFYDNLAHDQLRASLEDLGMRYTEYFTADQADFFKDQARGALEFFFQDFLSAIREERPVYRKYYPLEQKPWTYEPTPPKAPVALKGKKVAIVADIVPGSNIGPMVQRFAAAFDAPVEVVDLSVLNIRGACLGCMKCAFDNECTYDGKDDLKGVYNKILDPADIILYAGPLSGRYFSSRMKLFIERRFMRTHYPFMIGKQVALLVAGPLSQAQTLYDTFDADVQVSEAHFAGAVTDEVPSSAALDQAIDVMAHRLVSMSEASYIPPYGFLGIAGRKMFRDEVWGRYRFVFQADHRYYKKRGFYDFPQKDWRTRVQNFLIMLRLRSPRFRRQVRNTMTGFMVKPYVDELNKIQ